MGLFDDFWDMSILKEEQYDANAQYAEDMSSNAIVTNSGECPKEIANRLKDLLGIDDDDHFSTDYDTSSYPGISKEIPVVKEANYCSREYQDVLKEYFDLSDDTTLNTMISLREEDQSRAVESLTSRLYQVIVDKAAEVDFGTIPLSKGDITKIQGYDNLMECIDILKSLLIEYRQDTKPVDTITDAVNNIKSRTDDWERAFNLNVDFPMMLYNTIVLAIVSSVSLLIATSIEFIKDAGEFSFDIKLDKVAYSKNKDGLLFDNLKKFNKTCSSGDLDKSLEHIFASYKKQLTGVGMGVLTFLSISAVIGIVMSIVPIMRELIYFFYHTKQNVSDYFTIQADLIEMNSEYVKHNDSLGKSSEERKIIARKQQKIADRYRKIGNKLSVQVKIAEKNTKSDIAKSKKMTSKDIEDKDDPYISKYEDDNVLF